MTDRIAGTLLMGLDVAVEFATLGEFRLVEAEAATAEALQPAPLVRRPARMTAVQPDLTLLPPASTAIARAAAESAARAAARRPTPRLDAMLASRSSGGKAIIPSAPRRRPASVSSRAAAGTARKPVPRTRVGAVEGASQLCLFGG